MGNLIFPIFAFGCVITGIVFLGVLQAHDFAKAERNLASPGSEQAKDFATKNLARETHDSAPTKRLSATASNEPI